MLFYYPFNTEANSERVGVRKRVLETRQPKDDYVNRNYKNVIRQRKLLKKIIFIAGCNILINQVFTPT